MMVYEMRAEYAPDATSGPVRRWHMTRNGDLSALCGHAVAADAETMSEDGWGKTLAPFCHLCGALYLRQVV